MPFDPKYGRVTVERGTIGQDEVVVVFRGQDWLLPAVLKKYRELCERAGSPPQHLNGIDITLAEVLDWQADHPTQVPQSAALRAPGDEPAGT